MSLREKLQKPAVGYSVAGAILVLAAVLAYDALTGDDGRLPLPTEFTYLDLNTGEFFKGLPHPQAVAPVDAPSGNPYNGEPAGVTAYEFGCGSCDEKFVGYVEKWTPEAQTEWGKPADQRNMAAIDSGRRVLSLEDARQAAGADGGKELSWVDGNSKTGRAIVAAVAGQCRAVKKRLVRCWITD